MVAFTIGCSRYSLSNVTITSRAPSPITANPAVSVLKYGRPKKILSLLKVKLAPIELIVSTDSPPPNVAILVTFSALSNTNVSPSRLICRPSSFFCCSCTPAKMNVESLKRSIPFLSAESIACGASSDRIPRWVATEDEAFASRYSAILISRILWIISVVLEAVRYVASFTKPLDESAAKD